MGGADYRKTGAIVHCTLIDVIYSIPVARVLVQVLEVNLTKPLLTGWM